MAKTESAEVLVVGAGPVGLFTALALAEKKVDVRIVDAEWRSARHSYALALHPSSLSLLERFGILGQTVASAYRIDRVAFYDESERRAEVDLSRLDHAHPYVLVLPQSALEDTLEKLLAARGVVVHWNHRVDQIDAKAGSDPVVHLQEIAQESVGYAVPRSERLVKKEWKLTGRYVIGADGWRSVVRRDLDAPFDAKGDSEVYAVFECAGEAEVGPEVRVVLSKGTNNVLWPLPGGRYRWSFQLPGEGTAGRWREKSRLELGDQRYHEVSEKYFHELLKERAPWFKPAGKLDWAIEVPFEKRLARSYGRDRLWLTGDAAHVTSPVGAQSMNVGFREADRLAGALARLLREGGSADLLSTYERESLAEWGRLLEPAKATPKGDGVDAFVSANVARIVPCLPASGAEMTGLLGQLGLEWKA